MRKRKKDIILATGLLLLVHAAMFAIISILLSVYTSQSVEFVKGFFDKFLPSISNGLKNAQSLVTFLIIFSAIFTFSSLISAPIFIQKSNMSDKEFENNKKSYLTVSIFTVLLCGSIFADILIIISLCLNTYKTTEIKIQEKTNKLLNKRIDKTSKQLSKLKLSLDEHKISNEDYSKLVEDLLNDLKSDSNTNKNDV